MSLIPVRKSCCIARRSSADGNDKYGNITMANNLPWQRMYRCDEINMARTSREDTVARAESKAIELFVK